MLFEAAYLAGWNDQSPFELRLRRDARARRFASGLSGAGVRPRPPRRRTRASRSSASVRPEERRERTARERPATSSLALALDLGLDRVHTRSVNLKRAPPPPPPPASPRRRQRRRAAGRVAAARCAGRDDRVRRALQSRRRATARRGPYSVGSRKHARGSTLAVRDDVRRS